MYRYPLFLAENMAMNLSDFLKIHPGRNFGRSRLLTMVTIEKNNTIFIYLDHQNDFVIELDTWNGRDTVWKFPCCWNTRYEFVENDF